MTTVALDRIGNFLLLPTAAPAEDYVITQGKEENCWFVYTEADNTKLLQLASTQATPEQDRLLLMLQGTFLPLERQDNLLLLPKMLCHSDSTQHYFLKLALSD